MVSKKKKADIMKKTLTKEELTQLAILVGKAEDSERLQNSASISYMEAIDLRGKLLDIIAEQEDTIIDNKNKIVGFNALIVDGDEVKIPNDFDFEDAEIGYKIEDREDLIDTLYNWIAEAQGNDKELMKNDLDYLKDLDDEYIFSSYFTNEYIAASDEREAFNEILRDIKEAL